jgi:hypothetical protein
MILGDPSAIKTNRTGDERASASDSDNAPSCDANPRPSQHKSTYFIVLFFVGFAPGWKLFAAFEIGPQGAAQRAKDGGRFGLGGIGTGGSRDARRAYARMSLRVSAATESAASMRALSARCMYLEVIELREWPSNPAMV